MRVESLAFELERSRDGHAACRTIRPLNVMTSAPDAASMGGTRASAKLTSAVSSRSVRGPAMADVGRLAGVSAQTVSRVVNNELSVRATTRLRVWAAIDQLGYRRNGAARALVSGRSHALGVLAFDSAQFGPAATLHGIERAARESHYSVTVTNLQSTDRAAIRNAMSHLVEHGVDGVVALASVLSVAQALPAGLPMVAVEGEPTARIDVVSVDQHAGASAATRHLLDLGHLTVWHVAGPTHSVEANQRTAGWRSALECAGAEISPPLHGDWSARSGFEAGRVLARIPEISAIFVANDSMTVGVLRALHECGRQVPYDVSLVGFDDVPESAYLNPPLTTIHQDFGEVGGAQLRASLRSDRVRRATSPTPDC